jgi:hypothetical protein
VIARLEGAALTTSRSMQGISHHRDAVYEALRREEQHAGQFSGKQQGSPARKRKT